jgi:hypothetical protein
MRSTLLVAVALLPWSGVAAQSHPLDSAAVASLKRVLRLPQTTADARQAGVTDSAIRVILEEARRRGVPAGETQEVVELETDAVKAGAPKGEFGAFVQQQLAAGKRGRELAEAIRAEHARRGHGPKGAGAVEHQRGGPPETGVPDRRPPAVRDGADSARAAAKGQGAARADSAGTGQGRRQ